MNHTQYEMQNEECRIQNEECRVRIADLEPVCENRRSKLTLSYRRRPVSRQTRLDWIPAFAGMTSNRNWLTGAGNA
jgi:hypothetical protein